MQKKQQTQEDQLNWSKLMSTASSDLLKLGRAKIHRIRKAIPKIN